MKKSLIFTALLLAASFVFAKDITLKAGGKTFELTLAETSLAQSFIKSVSQKNLRFTEYGGFEFYTTNELPAGTDEKCSAYKAGFVYYNIPYRAISIACANHNLSNAQAVELAEFKDKTALEKLKKLKSGTVFVFE